MLAVIAPTALARAQTGKTMSIRNSLRTTRAELLPLSFYERFEYVVVLVLTALIAFVVVAGVWNLTLNILVGLVFSGSLGPSEYGAFQDVFGMILTVIIALEFKKSLLVMAAGRDTVVQIRAVLGIALLAICLKLILLDVSKVDALQVMALAATIFAVGIVYWLVSDRDRRPDGEAQE